MAVVSKTDRHGVDNAIEALQQSLFPRLIAYWDVNAVYTSYPRANKVFKDDDIIPEISLDKSELKEVLTDDNIGVNSFWLVSNSRPYDADNKQLIHDVSLIFQADLVKLYGQTNRADEEFNIDVLRELTRKNVFMFNEDITVITTIDAVYSDLTFSPEMKDKIIYTDISNLHVVRFDFEIRYNIDCIPTLAPICSGASETFNGNAVSPLANATTKNIIVQNDLPSPVQVGTILTDTPTSLIISVPQGTSSPLNTSNGYKTGQTTSYRTGDDGDKQIGNGVDFLTLNHTNIFGANTNRYTDTNGGQNYDGTGGSIADIIVDCSAFDQVNNTVLCWFRIVQGTVGTINWNAAIDAQEAGISKGGFANWLIPNMGQLFQICDKEIINASPIDYEPFNIDITSGSDRLWTSTTHGLVSRAASLLSNGQMAPQNKTNLHQYIVCRVFTLTELGL